MPMILDARRSTLPASLPYCMLRGEGHLCEGLLLLPRPSPSEKRTQAVSLSTVLSISACEGKL